MSSKRSSLQGFYSFYDKVAQEYGPPFMAKNAEVAIRHFKKVVTANPFTASDLELFCVAEFDVNTGEVVTPKSPVLVLQATALVPSVPVIESKSAKENPA